MTKDELITAYYKATAQYYLYLYFQKFEIENELQDFTDQLFRLRKNTTLEEKQRFQEGVLIELKKMFPDTGIVMNSLLDDLNNGKYN